MSCDGLATFHSSRDVSDREEMCEFAAWDDNIVLRLLLVFCALQSKLIDSAEHEYSAS